MGAINTTINSTISTVETLSLVNGQNPTVTHNEMNTTVTLNAASTPPGSLISVFALTMGGGGTATIDLLALIGTQGQTLAATGLKVQAFKLQNKGAAPVTLTPDATNGYNLLGASFKVVYPPGSDSGTYVSNNGSPVIGSGAHVIDVAGTSGDIYNVTIIVG